ncbi:hypothetical protein PRJ39_05210 [Lysobacter enzymogenes]|uniref:hypothetical protein n=1 Tax=Lysobacter enzymogenes TaxID=69 RepID=UPI003747E90E
MSARSLLPSPARAACARLLRAGAAAGALALALSACKPPDIPGPVAKTEYKLGAVPESSVGKIKLNYWKLEGPVKAGQPFALGISITNGSEVWLAAGTADSLRLSANWLEPTTYAARAPTVNIERKTGIGSGVSGAEQFTLVAPPAAGRVLLKLVLTDADGTSLEAAGVGPLHYDLTVDP